MTVSSREQGQEGLEAEHRYECNGVKPFCEVFVVVPPSAQDSMFLCGEMTVGLKHADAGDVPVGLSSAKKLTRRVTWPSALQVAERLEPYLNTAMCQNASILI